jgi:hypothetical protein
MEILIKFAGSGFELNNQIWDYLGQYCFKYNIQNVQDGIQYVQNEFKTKLVNNNDGTYFFKKDDGFYLVKFQ